MKRKQCQNRDCGVLFTPCQQAPGQTYCSRKECQQARKNKWNRKKFATDPDYREYKQASQARRKENNPKYWKEYRARHPRLYARNRDLQRIRNLKRLKQSPEPVIATPDECIVEIIAIADG